MNRPVRTTTSMRRRGGPAWAARPTHPPILQALILEAERQRVSRRSLAAIAEVPLSQMANWTQHPEWARFEHVAACLNALGITVRFAACGKREEHYGG